MTQIQKSNRISYIDSLRGFLLLLVIFGHAAYGYLESGYLTPEQYTPLFFLVRSTYGFHMHAFFALSGFLYPASAHFSSTKELFRSIGKKCISLGIPYLLCSIVYWGIKYMMRSFLQSPISVRTLLEIPFRPIEFFWYLYALLLIYILADCIDFMLERLQIRGLKLRVKNAHILLMCFFLLFSFFLGDRDNLNIFVTALTYMGYFYLGNVVQNFVGTASDGSLQTSAGHILRIHSSEKKSKMIQILICAILSLLTLTIFLRTLTSPAKCLFSVSMTLFLLLFWASCPLLGENRPLRQLGAQSMPVYIMHVTVVAAIRILLIKCGIFNPWLHIALGFTGGLLVPWFLYQGVIKRITFLDFFFYPRKYLHKQAH